MNNEPPPDLTPEEIEDILEGFPPDRPDDPLFCIECGHDSPREVPRPSLRVMMAALAQTCPACGRVEPG